MRDRREKALQEDIKREKARGSLITDLTQPRYGSQREKPQPKRAPSGRDEKLRSRLNGDTESPPHADDLGDMSPGRYPNPIE